MIQINPLQSYIDGGARAAITTPPSASLVFDLPGKAIWVKGVKLKGIDHTYTFSHDNYITLTNTPDQNNLESEDIKIGVNITALKNVIDTTYDVVTASSDGLAPAFSNSNKATTSANTTYHFLGLAGSTLKWHELPHRNIYVETTEVQSVSNTDPLKFAAGDGIEIAWDSTNKKIVITNSSPDVNHNTDNKVAQASTSTNYDYPVILKGTNNLNENITNVNFSQYLTFNPSTKILKINNAGVITTADIYIGATSTTDATAGLVPAATSANRNKFLRGDGTWLTIVQENTWRPIKVGGSEKLGSGTDTGAVDFVAGTGITLGWDATNKKITITNSAPDLNHNTDRTGIKKDTVSGTKKTDATLIVANSSSGLIFEGGTNLFKIGDGTNYVEIPVNPSFTVTDKSASILSSLTTLATIAGTDIKAKVVVEDKAATLTTTSQTIATVAGVDITAKITNYNTDENVKQTPKTDNVNRPLMMINGGTSAGEQTSTSMFSTGIYANASTKMITANGFVKGNSSDSYVLLGGGGHKLISNFSMSDHTHQYIPISGYDGIGSLVFADNTNTTTTGNSLNGLYGRVGTNDAWRIVGYGDTNSGALEIATGDDGTEPIYVRQYDLGGNYLAYTHIARTLTLLDASGNTSVPGILTAPTFLGNIAYTYLTGSTTTANQAIVSNGTANGWVLKTLGSRAFDSTEYIPKGGFTTANTTPGGWGTITTSNGYTGVLNLVTSDSAALVIGKKAENADNSISIQVDGFFYQNEGRYKVLDEYDISHTKWGDADKLDGYHLSDLYWANIKVQTNSDSTKVPTFSLLYLTNNNAYIYFTSGTNVGILLNYQNALHWYYGDGNTNNGININSSNNIGLGTSSPTAKLHVNGGVVVSNNTIWVLSNNSYGGSGNRMTLSSGHPSALPYTGSNTGKVGTIIYANGIGFRDTLNFTSGSYTYGNDSGWIRVIEEEANNGMLEIATGDDGTEPIRFRRYNTSSAIVSDVLVPNKTGTLALTSDITDHDSTLAISRVSNTNNLRVSLGSVNRDITLGALAWKDKASWTSDITNRPFEDSPYFSSTGNWGWNPLGLANLTHVYGAYFYNTSISSDVAIFLWFLASGPESSSYMSMNLSMDGNILCLGSMYANTNLLSGGKLGVGTISPSYKIHVNNGDIYTNLDMRARRLYLNDSNAFVYFTSGSNIGILLNYNGALHWYFGEGNTNSGININSSNNIGLGTSSPTAKLHVNGDVVVSNNTIWVLSSTSYSGSSNRMSISSGHPVGLEFSDTNSVNKAGVKIWANGIGIKDSYYNGRNANDSCWIRHIETTNNAGYMEIATGDDSDEIIYFNHYNTSSAIAYSSYIQRGNHYAVNFYTTSDRAKKQNISLFSEHIRKFQLKDTEKWHYGVIAQEVPKLFVDGEEGNLTVNYNSMLSYYIGLLENRVTQLESELKALKEKLGGSGS